MIGYTCAYMRYYYPKQFIAAYLNNANNEDDIVNGTNLAQSKGIEILPAKFGHSKDIYLPDEKENKIYKGVASIKFLNSDVANALYDMREQNFDSFIDIIKAFPGNSRQLDILIKLSYFEQYGKIGTLLRTVELYNAYGGKKLFKKDKCKLPSELLSKYCTETEKQWRVQDQDGLIKELCSMVPDVDVPIQSKIEWSKEYLGYISTVMPEKKDIGYVMDINTKWSPRITIYQLWDGKTVAYKVQKKAYEKNPFDKGCLLQFHSEMRNKSRKDENGQWIRLPEQEPWLTNYLINVQLPS